MNQKYAFFIFNVIFLISTLLVSGIEVAFSKPRAFYPSSTTQIDIIGNMRPLILSIYDCQVNKHSISISTLFHRPKYKISMHNVDASNVTVSYIDDSNGQIFGTSNHRIFWTVKENRKYLCYDKKISDHISMYNDDLLKLEKVIEFKSLTNNAQYYKVIFSITSNALFKKNYFISIISIVHSN